MHVHVLSMQHVRKQHMSHAKRPICIWEMSHNAVSTEACWLVSPRAPVVFCIIKLLIMYKSGGKRSFGDLVAMKWNIFSCCPDWQTFSHDTPDGDEPTKDPWHAPPQSPLRYHARGVSSSIPHIVFNTASQKSRSSGFNGCSVRPARTHSKSLLIWFWSYRIMPK